MRKGKRQRLEAAGWTVRSTQEFLGLTDAEAILVDIHAALAILVKEARAERRWTQTQLAQALGSSQSRVAKMEAADASVALDLMVRSLIVAGVSGARIGEAFASTGRRRRVRKSVRAKG